MKRVVKWMLILWVTVVSLVAAGPVEVTQVTKPDGIFVADDMFYLLEGTTIHMYNLKNNAYIGKFGKEGEGPGEIKKNPWGGPIFMVPHKGKLYITSMGKLSVFSKTGEFIREHKVNASDSYFPFADSFICMGTQTTDDGKMVMALFMADKDLNRGELLYASDFVVGMNVRFDFPMTPFYPDFTDDQIFVIAGKDGFAIDAFDKTGKKQYRIEKKEVPISVPASYRAETEKAFKRSSNFSSAWDFFKDRITYKKTYPPILTFFINEGRIYVLTNKMKGDDRECIVLDLKGKEIKRMTLPIPEQYGMEFSSLYTAYRSTFYQLRENEDNETWELHAISLK
jgi:hypothetical protein